MTPEVLDLAPCVTCTGGLTSAPHTLNLSIGGPGGGLLLAADVKPCARVLGRAFGHHAGQQILTEWSYKDRQQDIDSLVVVSGFTWTDKEKRFSLQMMRC